MFSPMTNKQRDGNIYGHFDLESSFVTKKIQLNNIRVDLDVADKFLDYVMLAESSLGSCVDQLIEEAAAIANILQVFAIQKLNLYQQYDSLHQKRLFLYFNLSRILTFNI